MGFFEWAIKREREKCTNIILSQNLYSPSTKIRCEVQKYGEESRNFITTYIPENESKGHIVNIHGGGLIAGNVNQNFQFGLWLADHGFTVHLVEYRLIPEVSFEEQIIDVCRAIECLSSQMKDKKKYLIADSAGCHLALIANAIYNNEEVQIDFGYTPKEEIYFDGVWFNSPMFETTGFNEIGIFMAKHFYGKKWWKKSYADYLIDPYITLGKYLPVNIWITTSKVDDLNKQAKRAFKLWRSHLKCMYGDKYVHDWNILYPEIDDETIRMNLSVLEGMTL